MMFRLLALSLAAVALVAGQREAESDEAIRTKPVVIRLQPQQHRPGFLNRPVVAEPVNAPRPTAQPQLRVSPAFSGQLSQAEIVQAASRAPAAFGVPQPQFGFSPSPPAAQSGIPRLQAPVSLVPQSGFGFTASPPASPAPPGTAAIDQTLQQFFPRSGPATPPPPPPVNIPPDVQNQLIKFFGLDSFGIPGLTGRHPSGFGGAVSELRAAGIPVSGLPANAITSAGQSEFSGLAKQAGVQDPLQPQPDILSQANPNFSGVFGQRLQGFTPNVLSGGNPNSNIPLPADQPGQSGLIGLLSNGIRQLVQESGVADAISSGLPGVLPDASGASGASGASEAAGASAAGESSGPTSLGSAPDLPGDGGVVSGAGIRRQPTAAQRALSGIAQALGGSVGGSSGPRHAGLPRIPGIPLLPGGIPRNAQGQIDVVNLIGAITHRVSNGTTLSDILPPDQLQTFADNVTDALLPVTPEGFDLTKFMGRWFEGINSPRATEQRCVVHHYGGLTNNDKTATFTALKIYREGSEFGPVRYSIGYAFRGGSKNAMLQMHSSETSDAQPFWIYKLGPEGEDPFGNPQYEWAIVSNWVKYPVTVLVRDPDTFKKKYETEVLKWLEDKGFINGFIRAFNLLQPAGYSNCQYADSTFQVFGRK